MTTPIDLDMLRLAPPAYLPALCRVGAMLAIAPPFASAAVPRRLRALLAMGLTIGLLPRAAMSMPAGASIEAMTTGAWIVGLGGEVLIGLALGMSLSLVFAAATMAGELIAHQLGLSLPEAYDPGGGSAGVAGRGSAMGQAFWLLAAVVFFAANGHHAVLRGLAGSFDAVPAMSLAQMPAATSLLVGLLQSATMLAVRLAAPVFVAALVADLAMGMVARTIPQLGVMTAGLTVRAIAGVIVVVAGIAGTVAVIQSGLTANWTELTKAISGT